MTNPISQAAVDAAKQVLLNEACLDLNLDGQEHYPGYHDAVVTTALEAAMPHIREQIAEEIRLGINEYSGQLIEQAARIAEGETK